MTFRPEPKETTPQSVQQNYAPTSKELHVSAQVYGPQGVRLLRLGRCNIKCSMSPWSGQDGQIDNPIALQG